MNELAEINQKSWELAASAMTLRKGKLEAYSTSQVRKIMSAAGSENFLEEILRIVRNYKPAPPQGLNPSQAQWQIREKVQKNRDFGNRLAEIIKNQDFYYVQKLLRYTLWNIKIIENSETGLNKIKLIIDCEGVDDKKEIVGMIKPIFEASEAKNDGSRRFNKNFRR